MNRFEKTLLNLSRHQSLSRIFDDFLQMSVCAFSHGRMEEEYLAIVKRYKPEELNLFAQALGELILDAEQVSSKAGAWDDVLGEYYMNNVSRSQASHLGQFFTPTHICSLMAQVVGSIEPCESDITVNDCTCGTSRNLISHSRLNSQNRFNAFYIAQDLDYTCVLMSVLNYVMFGLKGVVIHMNTLTMEIYRGYRIYMPETGLMVQPLSKQQCTSYLISQKEAPVVAQKEPEFEGTLMDDAKEVMVAQAPIVIKKYVQTSLFD